MAEPRAARRGRAPREASGSGEESERESSFGFAGDAKRFFKGILTEDLADTLAELAADTEVRDRAETFGVKAADAAWASPPLRAKLAVVPNIILRVGTPVFATVVAREVVQGLDRPAEWAREFAQGFARRIRELKETGPSASAGDTGSPSAPAEASPRRMSAAEVLTKHPEITAVIDRGLGSPDAAVQALAAEVQADIHAHLDYAHEGELLTAPVPLPPAPYDTALLGHPSRVAVEAFLETHAAPAERTALHEELRTRITVELQLRDLLRPLPAAADRDVAFAAIAPKADWLRETYPDQTALADIRERIAPHAPHADRVAFLFSAPADTGLPADVAQSAAWGEVLDHAVRLAAAGAPALIADAQARVATVAQAESLTTPPRRSLPLTLPLLTQRIHALSVRAPAFTRELFERRLTTLEYMHPARPQALTPADVRARLAAIPERKGQLTLELLKQRIALIKDAGGTRTVTALAGRLGKTLSALGADVAGTVVGDIRNGIRNLDI